VTAANEHRYDTDILDTSARRVVVGDGAIGTRLQPRRLQQPASTRSGRNTFGCKLVNLGNYDIADKIRMRVGSSWASRRQVTT
jgi:5-methyltetrahydrofolate--homocysteine methyltransferase